MFALAVRQQRLDSARITVGMSIDSMKIKLIDRLMTGKDGELDFRSRVRRLRILV